MDIESSPVPIIQVLYDSPALERVCKLPPGDDAQLVTDGHQAPSVNNAMPKEIIDDIKEIINDVIDKSVDQLHQLPQPELRPSYKYAPEKCLISTSRPMSERSSISFTPSYYPLSNPVEEIITTTRAQFVLTRSTFNNNV